MEDEKPQPPRLRDYTPVVERLDHLIDLVGNQIQVTIAASGTKPPKIKPVRRPEPAIDRVRKQKRSRAQQAMLAELEEIMTPQEMS